MYYLREDFLPINNNRLLFIASCLFIISSTLVLFIFNTSLLLMIFGIIIGLTGIFIWGLYFPNIILMILIILCYDILGLIPMLEYRLSWAWGSTPPDLLLIFIFFTSFIYFLRQGMKNEFLYSNWKLIMLNFAIIIYVIFLIFYSSYLTGRSSLNYALRVGGGHFLYYSSFIFAVLFINEKNHVIKILHLFRILAILTAMISIISNIFHTPIIPILHSYYYDILRLNLPGYSFSIFIIVFGFINKIIKPKEIHISLIEILINLAGFLLFLARVSIFSLGVMLVISLYLLRKTSLKKALTLIVVLIISYLLSYYILGDISSYFVKRLKSGYVEVMAGEGSFESRASQIKAGYEVFKKTPIFGTGFIREGSPFYEQNIKYYGFAVTYSADYGLASILFTTGIVGFILITGFILISIKKMLTVFRTSNNLFVVNLSIAVSVFIGMTYFVNQWSGNFYGMKQVIFYLVLIGIVLRSEFIFKEPKYLI